jgi:hypothetical protein
MIAERRSVELISAAPICPVRVVSNPRNTSKGFQVNKTAPRARQALVAHGNTLQTVDDGN